MNAVDIIALIDEQLAAGEPQSGYSFGDPQYPRCPHCNRHWHGLPITQRIAQMYAMGRFDESYLCDEDDTDILCEGSEFIGPRRPTRHEQHSSDRREVAWYFSAEAMTVRLFNEAWQDVGVVTWSPGSLWALPDSLELDLSAWFPATTEAFRALASSVTIRGSSVECSGPTPELDVEFGPQNWALGVEPNAPWWLANSVGDHWQECTIPNWPVPESPGYDFSRYDSDEQRGPKRKADGRSPR